MTDSASFQAKYPLSPKKFWKRILAVAPFFLLMIFFFSCFVGFIVMLLAGQDVHSFLPAILAWLISFALASAVIFGLYSWYIKAYIRTYFYDAGQGYLTIRKGAITPAEIHVMYQKIQDVYVDQDLLDRLMGLYDVHIASATSTSGREAHIDGVDAATADALKNFLLSSINSGSIGGSDVIGGVTMPRQAAASQAQQHIEVPSNISSITYPISPRWLISIIAGSLLSSIIIILVFGAQLVSFLSHGATPSAFAYVGGGYLILFCCIFGLQVIGSLLWKANFSWAFTPSFLEIHTGVISKSQTHLPYSSIQDVLIKQGMIERLFGLCTVTIQNAAQMNSGYQRKGTPSGTNFPGQPLAKGQELVEIIRQLSQVGQVIRLSVKSVSEIGRATQGVRVMRFKTPGDTVITVTMVGGDDATVAN